MLPHPTRRLSRALTAPRAAATALLTAALTAGVLSPAAHADVPGLPGTDLADAGLPGSTAADGTDSGTDPDSTDLPLQTQILDGMWDSARDSVDRDNPDDDASFYDAPEGLDLQSVAPGTVLKERTLTYHMAGIGTPLDAVQILYATTDALGRAEANVTSVIAPPNGSDGNVVSYQSAYDSSNPADNPSRAIAGNRTLGGLLPSVETSIVVPALMAGHPVVFADTEGKDANFAAGPAYGQATLDSLRAATAAASSPVSASDRIGFLGYSGGSIASGWAVALMPDYAPELLDRTVGVAEGGVLVNPVSNLTYAGDGVIWSGVVGFALSTLARTYEIDIDRYLTHYGQAVLADMRNLSIIEAAGRYPGLHWSDLALPEYPTPESAPEVKKVIDEINLGNYGAPQVPMFIAQGGGGTLEGTPEHATQGAGDGIMVAGDVRAMARTYCAVGTPVEYREYPQLSHILAMVPWIAEALPWLEGRFHGSEVTDNCADIAPGNEI